MVYADHTIPVTPRALAVDERFHNPNWTCTEGFTLRQLAVAAFIDHGMTADEARNEAAYLWQQARLIAAPELQAVA